MQPVSAQNQVQNQPRIDSISQKSSRIRSGTPRIQPDSIQNQVWTAGINSGSGQNRHGTAASDFFPFSFGFFCFFQVLSGFSGQNRHGTARTSSKSILSAGKLSRISFGHPACNLILLRIRSGTKSEFILSARNRQESVPGYPEFSKILLRMRSGQLESNQSYFYQPETVQDQLQDTQNAAGFCSESSPDIWNQFKMSNPSSFWSATIKSKQERINSGGQKWFHTNLK